MRVLGSMTLVLLVGCSGDGAGGHGQEGQPCRSDGSCDQDLVCLAGLCVNNPDSGWRDLPPPWPDGPKSTPDLPRPADGPLPDAAQPVPDLPLAPDLPPPGADQGPPPSCDVWSSWSCIKAPQPKVLCWSTCPGAKGAIWCDGGGNCYCTGQVGNCATGVTVNLADPCTACQTALLTHACCK